MKLDTVIIFTQQMEALAAFYQKGLAYGGEINRSPGHMGFPLDNGVYLGFDQTENVYDGGGVSLWFAVDDMKATFKRFVEAGATVRYENKQVPNGDVLSSLYDLDGNILGLVER